MSLCRLTRLIEGFIIFPEHFSKGDAVPPKTHQTHHLPPTLLIQVRTNGWARGTLECVFSDFDLGQDISYVQALFQKESIDATCT